MISKALVTDAAIIEGILLDDETALSRLYKLHFPMVLFFVQSNSGTEDDAKDIFQEAVIVFYEKVKAGQLELHCQIKTYLYSICRRLWLKKLSRSSRFSHGMVEDTESELTPQVEDEAEQAEQNELKFEAMGNALAQLGEPCKTLLEDFYIRSMGMPEITEKFGYNNVDSAKNQKYKCLMRLKKLFFLDYQVPS
ncbi:sigma-70 family RNA polymerase sigma factor [Rufibacter immobilis]|uniref:Sigma-70 family RNA polymerase sigma factor n=1 Tax=Rufibacter immobilis TaxID=1348778 RepID=A0A3M9MVI9_9BACT|nr:sigma-70 family RNA polymerase sigma factor [Rufibacter immobilis]RNI29480.1 sigma-70 family RNA polymerase sigma factor [Rufibacter immobilis]